MKQSENNKFDIVQSWIDNVAYSHSKSPATEQEYRRNFKRFCDFIGKTPEQILEECENLTDRKFRRKYAEYVRALIGTLTRQEYTKSSVRVMVASIKSFFKYNDLPLAYIPVARAKVVYHNRDITKEEITNILKIARPRDRAFFCISAQTGLRPHTICELKLKHIQPDFDENTIPCKINVPAEIAKGEYRDFFTFMGSESVQHLRDYLKKRPDLNLESYLFTQHGTEKKLDRRTMSHRFRDAVIKLRRKGIVEYEQKKKGKPGSIRLYNLRKWFRKQANQAGFEFVEFWMGHIVRTGQEEHYRPTDVEFHRKKYAEEAMPFLRLETTTPTETEKTITELKRQLKARDKEIDAMKETIAKIQPVIEFVNTFTHPREVKEMLEFVRSDYERSSFDPNIRFHKSIADKLDDIMRKEGVTQAEALKRLIKEDWERTLEGYEKSKRIAKARGLPITREDYEMKKKKLLRKRMKKNSKSD